MSGPQVSIEMEIKVERPGFRGKVSYTADSNVIKSFGSLDGIMRNESWIENATRYGRYTVLYYLDGVLIDWVAGGGQNLFEGKPVEEISRGPGAINRVK